MAETKGGVVRTQEDGVAILTIDRPAERNMLSDEALAALEGYLRDLDSDSAARVVILTGAKRDFFCGGVFNPSQMAALTHEQTRGRRRLANQVFDRLEALAQPVIAAVNGRAQAGGFELSLACDIRVAASHAMFAMPENTWGMFPGAGGPIRLPRLVGPGKAMEIIMTGRDVTAEEALRIGLVEGVVPADDLSAEVRRLAGAIAASGPLGNRAVKKLVRASLDIDLRSARDYSESLRESLVTSADTAEGIAAHREGRAPRFQGR